MSINTIEAHRTSEVESSTPDFFSKFASVFVARIADSRAHKHDAFQDEDGHFTIQKVFLEKEFHPTNPPKRLRLGGRHFVFNRSRGPESMKSFIYYPTTGEQVSLCILTHGKKATSTAELRKSAPSDAERN